MLDRVGHVPPYYLENFRHSDLGEFESVDSDDGSEASETEFAVGETDDSKTVGGLTHGR